MLGKEQGKGIVGEFEIDTYTQLYLKRIPRFRPVGRRRPGLWVARVGVRIPAARFLIMIVKVSLRKQTPSDFLKQIIGQSVVVKLNSGVDYRGVLACLDGYMNIALEQTEEYVNGQLKNKYGDAFIRANNVLYISTQKRRM